MRGKIERSPGGGLFSNPNDVEKDCRLVLRAIKAGWPMEDACKGSIVANIERLIGENHIAPAVPISTAGHAGVEGAGLSREKVESLQFVRQRVVRTAGAERAA